MCGEERVASITDFIYFAARPFEFVNGTIVRFVVVAAEKRKQSSRVGHRTRRITAEFSAVRWLVVYVFRPSFLEHFSSPPLFAALDSRCVDVGAAAYTEISKAWRRDVLATQIWARGRAARKVPALSTAS